MDTTTAGALPVRLAVDDRLEAELVPWLEGTLGWQVTGGDELPAAIGLVSPGRPAPTGVPTVLLVRDDDPPHHAARAASSGATVVRWPEERDHLGEVALRLLAGPGRPRPATTLRLGGAAGGVGTTTVALALGGLLAWHGRDVLVVASGDVPVPDVPVVAPDALSAHRTWDAAAPIDGVGGLRVVATHAGPRSAVTVPDEVVVLRDDGVAHDVDVLVCARDRAGTEALRATTAGVAVVVARGPLTPAGWARASGGSIRQVGVEVSARVARAGLLQRVPTALPGRWLASLAPIARTLAD